VSARSESRDVERAGAFEPVVAVSRTPRRADAEKSGRREERTPRRAANHHR
jgi:hypothetical protein